MGILDTGILGGFRKKAGSVVGRKHRGQDLITGLHRTSGKTKKATPLRKIARKKFTLLNSFLSSAAPLVNVGFKKSKHGNPVNTAFSYNYEHAFIVEEEVVTLDYAKLVFSKGNIEELEGLQLSSENGHVILNWLAQPQSRLCQHTDKVNLLFYRAVKKGTANCMQAACDRSSLTHSVDMKDSAGKTFHCYISLGSADGKLQGDSKYLGTIKVVR
ncbi:MAG: DUF6266 family protein [Bacteroidota bacterium]